MVNFLRDVMIVVAILATFIALAFYPSQEPAPLASKHDVAIGVPPIPGSAPGAGVEAVKARFEHPAPK